MVQFCLHLQRTLIINVQKSKPKALYSGLSIPLPLTRADPLWTHWRSTTKGKALKLASTAFLNHRQHVKYVCRQRCSFKSQEALEIEISWIVVPYRSTPPPFLLQVIVLMVIYYPLRYHSFVLIFADSLLCITLRPEQNGRHSADGIFKWICLNENLLISNHISWKYFPIGLVENKSALVQVMSWCLITDKPIAEQICGLMAYGVTRQRGFCKIWN